jgi:hypothetical protein
MSRKSSEIPDEQWSFGDFVRWLYPNSALKRCARLLGVRPGTAKHWMYETQRLPAHRRKQVSEVMLQELPKRRDEFLRQYERHVRMLERFVRGE